MALPVWLATAGTKLLTALGGVANGLNIFNGTFDAYDNYNRLQEALSEDERYVDGIYNALDKIDYNVNLYDSFIEREQLINDLILVAKETRIDPEVLMDDLEPMMKSGYFENSKETLVFSGALRDYLYTQEYSEEDVNTYVPAIISLLDSGKNFEESLNIVFKNDDKVIEDLDKYMGDGGSKDFINNIFGDYKTISDDMRKTKLNSESQEIVNEKVDIIVSH